MFIQVHIPHFIGLLSLFICIQGCDHQMISETSTLNSISARTPNRIQASSSPTTISKDDGFNHADTSCNVHLQSVNVSWNPKNGHPLETCIEQECFRTYTVSVQVNETFVENGAQVGLLYHSNLDPSQQWWKLPAHEFYEVERSNGRVNYNVTLAEHGVPAKVTQNDLAKAELQVIAFIQTADGVTYWDHNATDHNIILQNDPTGFQYNATDICNEPVASNALIPDHMPMMINTADTECRIHFNSSTRVLDQRTGAPVKTCTEEGCFQTLLASVYVAEDLVNAGAQVGLLYRSDLFSDEPFINLTDLNFEEIERVDGYVNYNLLIADRTIYTNTPSHQLSDVNIEVIAYVIIDDHVFWDHNADEGLTLLTHSPSGYQYNSNLCGK